MDFILGMGNSIIDNAPALVGFILPPFVDIVNKDVKNETERFYVSVFLCLVAACLLHWKELAYGNPEQFAVWVGIIFTESQTTYNLYFKHSNLRTVLQSRLHKREVLEEPTEESPIQ